MDLTKLTEAPFVAKHTKQPSEELLTAMREMLKKGGDTCFLVDCTITHPDDTEPMTVAFFGNGPSGEDNAMFFALARNAFDVMMRRGWYAHPTTSAAMDGRDKIVWFVYGVSFPPGSRYMTEKDGLLESTMILSRPSSKRTNGTRRMSSREISLLFPFQGCSIPISG